MLFPGAFPVSCTFSMSDGTIRPGWRKGLNIFLGAALRRINRPAVPKWQPRTLDTVHGNQLSGACSISQPQQEVLAAALAYAEARWSVASNLLLTNRW